MLVYLVKKSNVRVLNKSLIVPPAKINLLMRNYRTDTIGHKKRCRRYPEKLKNKIKSWKKTLEFANTYYPCASL